MKRITIEIEIAEEFEDRSPLCQEAVQQAVDYSRVCDWSVSRGKVYVESGIRRGDVVARFSCAVESIPTFDGCDAEFLAQCGITKEDA